MNLLNQARNKNENVIKFLIEMIEKIINVVVGGWKKIDVVIFFLV